MLFELRKQNEMKNKDLKILVVGAGDFPIYEKALYEAFRKKGYKNCELFTWNKYYSDYGFIPKIIKRIEQHYAWGTQVRRMNRDLLEKCKEFCPEIVFLYSCRLIYADSVEKIKKQGSYVASYCNDDPFSAFYAHYFWRHYINSLKCCDQNYVYRKLNLVQVKEKAGRDGKILRSYYMGANNRPCKENEILKNVPDVIFLGHMENDERQGYIDALLDLNIEVGLNEQAFGDWGRTRKNAVFLEEPRERYNQYICSCKIPLVFLSKINHDTYTRRCFEIPAAGAFLFCPYTGDLAEMFEENKEIVFYRDKQDFVEKIRYYLVHEEEREKIAQAGRERVLKDGHEVGDRVEQIIGDYEKAVPE